MIGNIATARSYITITRAGCPCSCMVHAKHFRFHTIVAILAVWFEHLWDMCMVQAPMAHAHLAVVC